MTEQNFDVVVVGASLAGCTAATLYARAGLKVALVDRNAEPQAYKQLCTHYIQASATPTLRRLGLAVHIEAAGGIRNAADMWTPWGWIYDPNLHDDHGELLHGYSIRRETLDPMLRNLALTTPGVATRFGCSVREIVQQNGRVVGIVGQHEGAALTLRASLVVAADGRNSKLAELAKAPTTSSANIRGGVFALYRNVALKRGTVSQMWFKGSHVAYVFPNEHAATVVAVMPPQHEMAQWSANPRAQIESYLKTLPDSPDLDSAELVGNIFHAKDYPNLSRPVVVDGMALIGDAAASMDPLYGVGCGWAFQTAEWLVDATAEALTRQTNLEVGLQAYAKRHAKQLGGHQFVIKDFSKRDHFNLIERLMFKAATRNQASAKHVTRFGMRISSLPEFLAPRAILRALWVNLFGSDRSRLVSDGAGAGHPRPHSSM